MRKRNIIAIIYDFDGTLSPQPMQEYTVFPNLNIEPKDFWSEVRKTNKKIKGEEIITYMMLMLEKADQKRLRIKKADLGHMADKIKFYPGVKYFFKRINKYVKDQSKGFVKVRHYVISSGLKELIKKTSIGKKKVFHNIFASEYYYNEYGQPEYPKLVVTDTVKTQFLFRINKGKENIADNINEYMDEPLKPIPFSNIIYIGDGMSDVPCMSCTKKNGGYAIAVFDPSSQRCPRACKNLFKTGRVDFIAPADYRKNSELDKLLKATLKNIMQGILFYNTLKTSIKKRRDN